MTTTLQLAAIVERARPQGAQRGRRPVHPATLTFQALRMEVNDELAGIGPFVRAAALSLRPGGRLAVISFHAGEDRIVKNALKDLGGRCTCPREAPRCECGRVAEVVVLTKRPVRPTQAETDGNPRARSARLRAAERIGAAAPRRRS